MAVCSDDSARIGDIELLQAPALPMTADAILEDLTHYFSRLLGRRTIRTRSPFLFQSIVFAVRDRLMERWNQSNIAVERSNSTTTSPSRNLQMPLIGPPARDAARSAAGPASRTRAGAA